jgi:enamine deaminase RidA (YjgF/YER057c/UK114 family)
MNYEARLADLGLKLPELSEPSGNLIHAIQVGHVLYCSGKAPKTAAGDFIRGKVGADVSADEAYEHARIVGLHLIAVWKQTLGDLQRVKRVAKVLGLVNATPDFTAHPKVINGCSDLFVEVFGDAGQHARSAVGVSSLPNGITVEIEVIVEVEPA